MSTTLEKWSVHHLKSIVDYLDDESLLQITQTALNLSSAEEVATHFQSLLGSDPKSYAFISEFNSRRFPPSSKASVPSKRAQNIVQPGNRHDVPEKKADTKAASKKPVGNTFMTSDLGVKSRSRAAASGTNQKVKKVDALSEIDAALRDLELNTENDKKRILSCDCAARRHGLNEISPNCLSCGKIICTIESYARCSFCNAELLTRNQKDEIVAELKRERGVESASAKQQKKKASAGSGMKVAYSGKLVAMGGSTNASRMDEEEIRTKTEAAETRKNELLAHVQSGYRRTVIDQASDFTSQSTDKWSSPAERALALRRAQAAMHTDDDKGRVMSISLGAGKVSVKNEKRAPKSEDEVDSQIAREQRKIDQEREREAEEQAKINQSYTRNKLMGSLGKITFPSTDATDGAAQDWWTRGQKGWRRVQDYDDEDDDEGDGVRERVVLQSQALDGQPGREEEVGTSKRG
ncbi:Uncharacterized protein C1A6.01c [Taphrina deformans PYCC 5710]|uniref:Uncharacterized protein C1A6.01c n=1 Tax=Taphrina deformans (strain PYCC 5710 / ATCC 11124 / CBS 356.35 / IMI 108563 / JCM 9778 / NBRC 8474) TaxID=1097556 RepID=R4X8V5_TAPDE|nr:Uncharacterized protein C1A6.01c [Taphrina deformans PYCC 5710]|eukprot:CCG81860.1 Uncharacterized protein C1A6.01c [Taphrina deformans PYCC 5710]